MHHVGRVLAAAQSISCGCRPGCPRSSRSVSPFGLSDAPQSVTLRPLTLAMRCPPPPAVGDGYAPAGPPRLGDMRSRLSLHLGAPYSSKGCAAGMRRENERRGGRWITRRWLDSTASQAQFRPGPRGIDPSFLQSPTSALIAAPRFALAWLAIPPSGHATLVAAIALVGAPWERQPGPSARPGHRRWPGPQHRVRSTGTATHLNRRLDENPSRLLSSY